MKKILYVSDLDGTLFDNDANLSDFTTKNLNTLIASGLQFTIATGRGTSCLKRIDKLNLQLPIIIRDGAAIYDFKKDEFVYKKTIPTEIVKIVLPKMKKYNYIITVIESNDIKIFSNYERKNSIYVKNFDGFEDKEVIAFSFKSNKEELYEINKELKKIKELSCVLVKSTHSDMWSLDCVDKTVSKYFALNFLKNKYGFSEVVYFGDNLNDLHVFDSDIRSYAVANAVDEIKKTAVEIIGSNVDDGVIRWLLKNAK